MAHKVLHQEFDEAVRAQTVLFEAKTHVEDQLHQLDVMIILTEAELWIPEKTEKGGLSAS